MPVIWFFFWIIQKFRKIPAAKWDKITTATKDHLLWPDGLDLCIHATFENMRNNYSHYYLWQNTSLWMDAPWMTSHHEVWLWEHFSVSSAGWLVCFPSPWLVLQNLRVTPPENRAGSILLNAGPLQIKWTFKLTHRRKGYMGKNNTKLPSYV